MSGDLRNHSEKIRKVHFHPQKWLFLKISRNSQHQKVVTRNKTQHQKLVTRNKTQHQKMVTRNKPRHQKMVTRNKPQHQKMVTPEQKCQIALLSGSLISCSVLCWSSWLHYCIETLFQMDNLGYVSDNSDSDNVPDISSILLNPYR